MRIIGFSSAAAPSSFWTLPVQALGPWMSRIKLSVEQLVNPAAQGDGGERMQAETCVATRARAASNEALFALPEMPVRPGNTVKAGARAAPLRVVRESDAALGAECAGRMVISVSTAIEYEYRFEEAATQYGYTQRISFLPRGPRAGRA